MKMTSKDKLAQLRAALLEQQSKEADRLAHDLDTCGVDWQGRYPCRSPACPRCRPRNIRTQQTDAREFFAEGTNENLGWMTVVLGGATDLGEVDDLVARSYRATRNRINAGRRATARWADFRMKGWHEIDALGAEHCPVLGTRRKALLDELGALRIGQNGPIWVPTYHAIVQLGHQLDLGEVRAAFQKQWPVPGQVHITPFNQELETSDNIDRLTGYANKHCCTVRLDHVREPWPVSWQAQLYTWLHATRNAFEYLRFGIGPAMSEYGSTTVRQSSPNATHDPCVNTCDSEYQPLPMLVSFNTIPMLY